MSKTSETIFPAVFPPFPHIFPIFSHHFTTFSPHFPSMFPMVFTPGAPKNPGHSHPGTPGGSRQPGRRARHGHGRNRHFDQGAPGLATEPRWWWRWGIWGIWGMGMATLWVLSWFYHVGMSENGVYPQWNSHLVGIMISKTIGFLMGTLFSDKPMCFIYGFYHVPSVVDWHVDSSGDWYDDVDEEWWTWFNWIA